MSLQVYFDETLIDEKYYTGLTNNYELFSDSFLLGATPCNKYNLSIAKQGVTEQPSQITLYDNATMIASLEIDKIEEKDYEYVYTLTDKMVNLEFGYDASEIFVSGSTTLLAIAQDICNKVGLTLGTVNFRGYDKVINWYDNTRTARQYIGYIAELNGGFARIQNNVLYFVKHNMPSQATISIDDCDSFRIGEYHKITRVVYELGTLKYEFGDETGNTLYLNPENVYINSEEDVEEIYNDIKNFEFYSFGTDNCPIDYSIKAGDLITFTDGTNNYKTIAQYDLEYFQDWYGGYDLDINSEKQEETKLVGEKESIRNLRIIVDRDANTINQVVEEVGEQNQKISQTQQTVNELNAKISDIADITTQQETIYARLEFEGINQSEPIEIKIHPTTTNISYLYPFNTLYPSDTLYMPDRILRFTNTDTEEYIDYILPDDLLIEPNSGTYDEFYLGYDQQICSVTKRCKYNADGTVGLLDEEQINTYTYPVIQLEDGDYTVELLGYSSAYMSVRLMAQNIYTTQFATKAELNSEISQTAQSITSTVSETYETKQNAQTNYSQIQQTATGLQSQINANNTDISTLQQTATGISSRVSSVEQGKADKNAIVSEINQSSEAVTINANKISLNGKTIDLTGQNIKIESTNFNVDKNGNMTCNNANITGGKIDVTAQTGTPIIKLTNSNDTSDYVELTSGGLSTYSQGVKLLQFSSVLDLQTLKASAKVIEFASTSDNLSSIIGHKYLRFSRGNTVVTTIATDSVRSPTITQTSKQEDKKNFIKLQDTALKEIQKIDIYKYNLKNEADGDKKHIGFVIGNDFNYSQEVTSKDNDGVDIYSFTSLCCKAIQEQQKEIEELQKQIKELKEEK